MTTPAPLTLIIFPIDGQAPARRVSVQQESVSVGREADNAVTLSDPTVSRRHFTLTRGADESWRMERQPGARSLYFNGEPRDTAPLSDGDQIVIGQTVVHIELPEAPQKTEYSVRTVLAPPPTPRLLVECPGIRFEAPLRQGTVTLGRAPGVSIIVPSLVIGAQHAVMQRDAHGHYTIQAPSAVNDFVYQGVHVRSHALRPNDTLLVGMRESDRYATLTYLEPEAVVPDFQTLAPTTNGELTIGRDPTCDLHLPNPTISWRHARFSRDASGHAQLQDLGSRNGSYVNNVAITQTQSLRPGDTVQFGPYRFQFDGVTLSPLVSTATGFRIDASSLTRTANKGGAPLLDNVSLTIRPGEFVTIVGGSGAGKTTLLNALAGIMPAQSGQVLFDGVDSYAHYDLFRGRMGYVPQNDIVHMELTVAQALHYIARLRLPADLRPEELEQRIQTVLETVELTPRRDSVIGRLSGGEKKRVSLAVELLAEPQILFLDEPNSSLDPDLRGELQRTIRTLTARGQTVVMVTHFLEDIEVCDRVAVMGRGGALCYYGPPPSALGFFQVAHLKDIYAQTNTSDKAQAWRARYEQSAFYATDARDRQSQTRPKPDPRTQPARRAESGERGGWSPYARSQSLPAFAQFWLLTRRYARVLRHDRQRMALLLLQAPIIGTVLALVSKSGTFTSANGPYDAQTVLFLLAVVAIWFGTSNAASEISKEVDIYKRERLAGVGIVPYLLSKTVVLATLGTLQTLMLLLIVTFRTGMPPASAGILTAPPLELYIGMTLAGLAGLAMGLCISTLASNPDKATGAVPLVLLPQIMLAGTIFSLTGPVKVAADVMISRWAVQSLGTSADLNHLYYTQQHALPPTSGAQAAVSPTLLYHPSDYDNAPDASHYTLGASSSVSWADAITTRRDHLLLSWGVVVGMFVAFLTVAGIALKWKDPH